MERCEFLCLESRIHVREGLIIPYRSQDTYKVSSCKPKCTTKLLRQMIILERDNIYATQHGGGALFPLIHGKRWQDTSR